MSGSVSVDRWREELGTAALMGTARRPVPAPPEGFAAAREGAAPEVALLDGIALTSAIRRAGATPLRTDEQPVDRAPDDRRPPPPARARQLLDLLLTQPPVGARLAAYPLLVWLRTAEARGARVHHPALVPLLEKATTTALLRPAVRPVLDSRGTWLASANPAWSWAVKDVAPAPTDDEEWARLPTLERTVHLRLVRAQDPGRGRALVERTWDHDPAPARGELLGALEVGLSIGDEELLERALDDRAAGVREVAYRLLDGLPTSRRARRLGDVLRPLVTTSGLLRTKVHVALPTTPAPEAARDGLATAPRGRSERGFWLQRLAAGAPFGTWTEASGADPATVVRTLDDADALAGLQQAAVARRDATWARALLDRSWDPRLARCLPPEEAADRMLARVDEVTTVPDLAATLRLAPGPWPERTSARIVARLAALERHPHQLHDLVPALAEGLHPRTASAVQALAVRGAGPNDPLHQLAQHLALVPTITEAFG